MSRIFLSHSSKDNDRAVAVREWLAEQGWDDVFLDLDPRRGIAAGERWERRLNHAALRCEAVLFLVSRAWLASDWCVREFDLAHRLNKRLFGVLIDDLSVSDLPPRLAASWQLVSLAAGRDHIMRRVRLPSSHEEAHVTFSQEGLSRLKLGLERAGLDARFFAWPPADDPQRSPYRGLLPLEAADAGIFFGREAPTIEALDRIRGIKQGAAPRFLVVLGASGAGKSSFLRAGLLPRLSRDDRNYIVLPVVRPVKAAILGETGLLRALETALSAHGFALSRANIREAINGGGATLRPLLQKLVEKVQATAVDDDAIAALPLLVLAIDQCEELFTADGAAEDAQLLSLLRDLVADDRLPLLVLVTIRSDSFELLQTAKVLEGITQQTLSLSPMPRGAYQAVIEGPVARLNDTDRSLTIEPALAQALLLDIEEGGGRDALPLLAFTLERLYLEYGASKQLTLADYDALGRIKGSIEAAVEQALSRADQDPRIPKDRQARLLLLRRGLIPWLAGIDPESGSPRRQKARISEIPTEARLLIDLLVDQRLLSTDVSEHTSERTIEPAHEALLRQWGSLHGWLAEDFAALTALESVRRGARDWDANERRVDWLAHRAGRLEDAERLQLRPDLAARLAVTDRQYLAACREREEAERSEKTAALERELQHQQRARTRARRLSIAAALVAVVMTGAGIYVFIQKTEATAANERAEKSLVVAEKRTVEAVDAKQRAEKASREAQVSAEAAAANEKRAIAAARRAQREEARTFADASARESAAGNYQESIRLALQALPQDLAQPDRPFEPRAELALKRAMLADRLVYAVTPSKDRINASAFSPDHSMIALGTRDGIVALVNAATGKVEKSFNERRLAVFALAFTSDGGLVASANQDPPFITVRNVQTGEKIWEQRVSSRVNHLEFLPGDKQLVSTGSANDSRPHIWSIGETRSPRVLEKPTSALTNTLWTSLSADGRFLAVGALAWMTRQLHVWDLESGKLVLASDEDASKDSAASFDTLGVEADEQLEWGSFQRSGSLLVLRSPTRFYIFDPVQKKLVKRFQFHDSYRSAISKIVLTDDGKSVVVPTSEIDVVVFNLDDGTRSAEFKGHTSKITDVAISPDGQRIATSSADFSIRVWDMQAQDRPILLRGHRDASPDLRFAGSSDRLLSSGGDTARLWDVREQTMRVSPVLPDGWTVMQAGPDGAAALLKRPAPNVQDRYGFWNLQTQIMLRSDFSDRHTDISRSSFSPDGSRFALNWRLWDSDNDDDDTKSARQRLLSVSNAHGGAKSAPETLSFYEIIDPKTGRTITVLPSQTEYEKLESSRLVWSTDGSLAAVGSETAKQELEGQRSLVKVWQIDPPRLLFEVWQQGSDPVLKFSPRDETLLVVTQGGDGEGRFISAFRLPDGDKLFDEAVAAEDPDFQFVGEDRFLLLSKTSPSLRDVRTGRAVGQLPGAHFRVSSVEVSADERRMLVRRDDGPVTLWDLTTRQLLCYAPSEDNVFASVVFSGDERRVIAHDRTYKAHTVAVFDAETGKRIKTTGTYDKIEEAYGGHSGRNIVVRIDARQLEIHGVDTEGPVRRISLGAALKNWRLTASDERLVTADADGVVQIWNVADGRLIKVIADADRREALGSTPSGAQSLPIKLAAGGAALIDTMTGAIMWSSEKLGDIERPVVSRTSRNTIVARQMQVDVFSTSSVEQLLSIPLREGTFRAATFLAGDRLLIQINDGSPILYDLNASKTIREYDVVNYSVAADGGSVFALARGQVVEIVDSRSGEILYRHELSGRVTNLHISSKTGEVVVSTSDKAVWSIDGQLGRMRKIATVGEGVAWVHSAGGKGALIRGNDKLLTYRSAEDGAIISFFPSKWSTKAERWIGKVDSSNAFVAIRTPDNFVRAYRTSDGVETAYFHLFGDAIADILLVRDGSLLLALGEDGKLRFWNLITHKNENTVDLHGKFSRYKKSFWLTPSASQVVAVDENGRVSAVSLATHQVRTFDSGRHESDVVAQMSADGRMLATYSPFGVRVWDAGLAELILDTSSGSKEEKMYDVRLRFSADNRHLFLENSFDNTMVFKLPAARAELIKAAKERIANAKEWAGGHRPRTQGLGIVMATPPAQTDAAPRLSGVVVTEVMPESAALDAGLVIGDSITAINETPVNDPDELRNAIRAADKSKNVLLSVTRRGARLQLVALVD